MMKQFLSCDWGTSSFRLRLIDPIDFAVMAEETSEDGIAATFAKWQAGEQSEENRVAFYLNLLQIYITNLERKTGISLKGVQVIISGMASSNIGFIEIPYTILPIDAQHASINIASIPANTDFEHDVVVISGLRTNDDVIRGEETQLIGCIDLLQRDIGNEIFIFPGTHSKRIHIVDNQIIDFKTYMTGEFFELLSQKSILKNSVNKVDVSATPENLEYFEKGVSTALDAGLLHAAFMVRTNSLFGKVSKEQNFCYLSGLLIGTELKELTNTDCKRITLIGDKKLIHLYNWALGQLGLSSIAQVFSSVQADEALIRGQYKIYRQTL